jgi:hypothetical protein
MWRWRRRLIERNNRMGPLATIAINVLTLIFAYVLVIYIHRLGFYLGWLQSPGVFSTEDTIWAAVTGVICGLVESGDRDRKQRLEAAKRQGNDPSMI